MKSERAWILDYCRPADWTVDMSHPGGDWDQEFEPGTDDYNYRQIGMQFKVKGQDITHAIHIFSKQMEKVFSELGEIVKPVFDEIAEKFKPITEMIDTMTEDELKKNGLHKVKSVNPHIELPDRTFNSGPPQPKFDRRKK